MKEDVIEILNIRLDGLWKEFLGKSAFIRYIMENQTPIHLYAQYLLETYHYTRHNALNQAIAGARPDISNFAYQRFCFHHAEEEVGHHMMALSDLKNLGYRIDESDIASELPETTVLIGYLYWISQQGNPVQRLGYSFWAENCYSYISATLRKVRQDLDLSDKQMSFFIAHAQIDAGHAVEVENIIKKVCKTKKDIDDISVVMETTLRLTVNMMDSVLAEYHNYRDGNSYRLDYLSEKHHAEK